MQGGGRRTYFHGEMRRLTSFFLLFNIAILGLAQTPLREQTTFWYRLYATKSITRNLKAGLMIEDRKYVNPWRSHIFFTELNLQRRLADRWTVAMHGTYLIFALPHDPQVQDSYRVDELRIHQSVTYPGVHIRNVGISFRTMLEQRLFKMEGEDGSMGDFTYTYFRIRNRMKVKIPVHERVSLILSEEYMIQSRKDVDFDFDQNRAGISTMYKINDVMSFEMGYLHWYQVRTLVRYSRHSWRTAIYLKL